MSHTAVLTHLTPGALCHYIITASDHRTDTNASPNPAFYTNTYVIPSVPVTPPVILGLTVTNLGGSRATLVWSNDRPCAAQVTYHSVGSTDSVRTFADLSSSHACVLDLLESIASYTASLVVIDSFNLSATQSITFTTTAASTPAVTITINPVATNPISPWIYGINFYQAVPNAPRHLTLNRAGGNRWTAYNWENNASNAGYDWLYENDDYLGGGDTPAETVRRLIATDRASGNASLVTLQLQGYVAADKSGPVNLSDPNHLATRFKQVVYRKGAPFTATPSTADDYVYMDEFLWALRGLFPGDIYADPTTPTFVSLDNEPDIWAGSHTEVQPQPAPVAVFIQNTIAMCKALKSVDPSVKIFGPVNYGFNGIVNWQNAPDFTATADYWFPDRYLADLKAASDNAGQRLLDVYDFHWYTAAKSANGVGVGSMVGSNLTDDQIQAIVQSPRSLWDPTYREKSWIADYLNGPIYILGRMQAKIDAVWPGTKLAITEYNNGGNNHIAGAIAQADNLGIFASSGLFSAAFWPMPSAPSDTYPFVMAAFKMYRDFDGKLGSFGDVSISATSSDTSKVAAYMSQDSTRRGRYVIVAINRSTAHQDVGFNGSAVSGLARVYRLEGTNTSTVFAGQVPANLASWVITLPPLSVSTIEIVSQPAPNTYAAWVAANFSEADQQNAAMSGPYADPDHAGLPNLLRYAFNLPPRGIADVSTVPQVRLPEGHGVPDIQFNRRAAASDISYTIEGSFDLTHWTTVSTVAPGAPVEVAIQDTVAVNSVLCRFLRVRVSYTP